MVLILHVSSFHHSFILHHLESRTRPISTPYDGRCWWDLNLRTPACESPACLVLVWLLLPWCNPCFIAFTQILNKTAVNFLFCFLPHPSQHASLLSKNCFFANVLHVTQDGNFSLTKYFASYLSKHCQLQQHQLLAVLGYFSLLVLCENVFAFVVVMLLVITVVKDF